jgi:hypothetical protein
MAYLIANIRQLYDCKNHALRQQFSGRGRRKSIETIVFAECKKGGIVVKELLSGGRRPNVSQVIAEKLFQGSGIPLTEIARHTGVSTSAISKALAATN